MLLVGLTGGIGAGKSSVAALLADRGAVILDADQVARDVVEPDQPAFTALVERFGSEIVGVDGRLDRPKLAEIAFATDGGTADLNEIVHPAVGKEFLARMQGAPAEAIVVCDVPLLVESETARSRGYEYVIVVEAPLETRLDRLEERGVARNDAVARIAQQATDEERRAIATHLVDNAGDREQLEAQIDAIWKDLQRLHAEKTPAADPVGADDPQ
jgi:dephospho-CoA kinase